MSAHGTRSMSDVSLIVTLIGQINAGKSSLANALLGRELAETSPCAGWTREVLLYPYGPEHDRILLADTPGLEDPEAAVAARTFDYLGQTDLFLHLINCAGGLTRATATAHRVLRATSRPVALILSRADTLAPQQRAAFAADVASKCGHPTSDPPIWVSTVTGEGIKEVHAWIGAHLVDEQRLRWERVRRLATPKVAAHRGEEAERIIRRRAALAAGIGATPLPIADMPVLLALQVEMGLELARLYEIEIEAARLREVILMLLGGFVAREAFRQLVKLLPGAGWALGGGVAGSTTYALGKALQRYYESGMRISPEELRRHYREARRRAARELPSATDGA